MLLTSALADVHTAPVTAVRFDDFKIVSGAASPDNRIVISDFLREKEFKQDRHRLSLVAQTLSHRKH